MGALLQLFKDFFLILTTGFIVYWFLADYRKALTWYLIFYALISMLGIGRAIYNENILIPFLLLFVLLAKPAKFSSPNLFYTTLFIYMVLITYMNGLSITDSYSNGTYLFVVLLIYSRHLFSNSDYAIKIVVLIWLITLGIAFNFMLFGKDIFTVSNINSEERNLILDMGSTFGGAASTRHSDLNYFSSGQAIGAILTLLFYIYRKNLFSTVTLPLPIKQFIKSKFFPFSLILISAIQIWLVFRGISRGGLFVLLVGILTLVYMQKKKKYFLYGGILLLILYWVMSQAGIIDLFMERITNDETGTSGRDFIWIGMIGTAYDQGGIFQIIFGKGIDWPWWDFWIDNYWDTAVSSHNQWLTILINFGLVGLILFLVPLVQGIRNSYKNPNPINNIRIVLFASFFAMSLSLEPLIFTRYLWLILAISATYTPNIIPISDRKNLKYNKINIINNKQSI